MRLLSLVLPGVRRVLAQREPYAQHWVARNRQAWARDRRRWVVLGDSMAQGIGAAHPEGGWAGQLEQRLHRTGHRLDLLNLSATGARTTDVLAQQLPILESVAHTVDLVTVLIGSNDLFGGREHSERLPSAMAELVQRLPDGSVVATLPQPRDAAQAANAHIESAQRAGRIHVVDMRTAGPASWKGKLAPDFFHPNESGYSALTDAFEPVVRRRLTD
ncbi:SGNH/GDSL hydrolase family protein [Williamsia sp. CHRR-6]|uniref:SGNH/GDSL hydrolase family protein n=1 Tax=Williamsia sp. CHRR-6 TaxID=2835871 RepID=UPI001BD9FAD9|nr:SGNH/GDSL hydrolase family protein [Williamsia sp. CHRR-6]MBT0567446.1 SGNH/GDSL hydrolase family protein [Williamsia sp. CHRR-6]